MKGTIIFERDASLCIMVEEKGRKQVDRASVLSCVRFNCRNVHTVETYLSRRNK